MKRWTIAALIILIISSLFFCRDRVVLILARSYVTEKCSEFLHADLKVGDSYIENGKIVWKEIELSSLDSTEVDVIRMDQVVCQYSFDFFTRTIEFDIELQEPNFIVKKQEKPWWLNVHIPQSSSFRGFSRGRVKVKNALVSCMTGLSVDPYLVFGEGNLSWGIGEESRFRFYKDRGNTSDYYAEVTWSGNRTAGNLSCELSGLPLELLPDFLMSNDEPWELSSGLLSGNFSLYKEDSKLVNHSDLQLDQLAIEHVAGIRLFFPKTKLVASGPITGSSKEFELEVELLDSASFYLQDEVNAWQIADVKGSGFYTVGGAVALSLEGIFSSGEETCLVQFDGKTVLAKAFTELDCALSFFSNIREERAGVSLVQVTDELGKQGYQLELGNLSEKEFKIFQILADPFLPEFKHVDYLSGVINGELQVDKIGSKYQRFKVSGLDIKNLSVNLPFMEAFVKARSVHATFDIDCADAAWRDVLNGHFVVESGQVELANARSLWVLEDIDSEISCREGTIINSMTRLSFAGLRGQVDLDLHSAQFLTFKFEGNPLGVANILPPQVAVPLREHFVNDHIDVVGGMRRYGRGVHVEGDVLISGDKGEQNNVAFGFDLQRVSKKIWGDWEEYDVNKDRIFSLSNSVLSSISNTVFQPTIKSLQHWLEYEFGISGLLARNGWFAASGVPVEKYVAPFIFKGKASSVELSGVGAVQGTFDHDHIKVHYQAKDVLLDSPSLKVSVENIGSSHAKFAPVHGVNELGGVHYCDLKNRKQFGWIPLKNAWLFTKRHEVEFENLNGLLVIGDRSLRAVDVSCISEGVQMQGSVEVDFLPNKESDLRIRLTQASGDAQQARAFLDHFVSAKILEWDWRGRLLCNQGFLAAHFSPKESEVTFSVSGQGKEVELSLLEENCELADGQFDFTYDHASRLLSLSSVKSDLLIGKEDQKECCVADFGDLDIQFSLETRVDFDIRVLREGIEFAQLNGIALLQDMGWQMVFNQNNTRIGHIYPNITELVLKNNGEVERLQAQPKALLSTVSDDLLCLGKAGLITPVIPRRLADMNLKASGDLKGKISLDSSSKWYQFTFLSEGIHVKDLESENFYINGRVQRNRWIIDSVELDQLELSADVQTYVDGWSINFLGANFDDIGLLGLEGEYSDNSGVLDAHISFLELDLLKWEADGSYSNIFSGWLERGKVQATGSLRVKLPRDHEAMHYEAQLQGVIESLEAEQFALSSPTHFEAFLSDSNGFSIEGMEVDVPRLYDKDAQVGFSLGRFTYLPNSEQVKVDDFSFSIPGQELQTLRQVVTELFPYALSSSFNRIIKDLSKEDTLEGVFVGEKDEKGWQGKVRLDGGVYSYQNHTKRLKDIELYINKNNFRVLAQHRLNRRDLWLDLDVHTEEKIYGNLIISEKHPGLNIDEDSSLKVDWMLNDSDKIVVRAINGCVSGIKAKLARVDEDNLKATDIQSFLGSLKLDIQEVRRLFDQDSIAVIEMINPGQGYVMDGRFDLDLSRLPYFAFEGTLRAHEMDLYGYKVRSLSSLVSMGFDQIAIKDIEISDRAGTFRAPLLRFIKEQQDVWQVSLPTATITAFVPSVLRPVDQKKEFPQALVLEFFQLEGVEGTLGDASSFKGNGTFTFNNKSSKQTQNALWAIPSDLISRIGLTTHALTPVEGGVVFVITEGKVYFEKLSNVYSQSKLSKFYFPKNAFRSYLDFSGNLNVRLRMRQYNLLLKFAELFTISIRGTLHDPKYSLQKQPVEESIDQVYDNIVLDESTLQGT